MNGKIVEMDGSAHQKVQKLLPWLLSETLAGAELALVRKHLRGCEECREDLAWQRSIQAAEPATDAPHHALPNVERAFAALSGRLGEQSVHAAHVRPGPSLSVWLRRLWRGTGQWQRWTMAAQCALIAFLAVALVKPAADGGTVGGQPRAEFRALSAPPPAPGAAALAGNVLVMFKPDTTEAQLRRVLNAHGARIVDGPTVTDAYVLLLSGADQIKAIAALRREPAVTLAEALAQPPAATTATVPGAGAPR